MRSYRKQQNYHYYCRSNENKSLAKREQTRLENLCLCNDKFARETRGQFTFQLEPLATQTKFEPY